MTEAAAAQPRRRPWPPRAAAGHLLEEWHLGFHTCEGVRVCVRTCIVRAHMRAHMRARVDQHTSGRPISPLPVCLCSEGQAWVSCTGRRAPSQDPGRWKGPLAPSRGPSHCLQVSSEEALPSHWRQVRRPRGTHGRSGQRSPGLPCWHVGPAAPRGPRWCPPGVHLPRRRERRACRSDASRSPRSLGGHGEDCAETARTGARGPRAGRWGLWTWGWRLPAPQRGRGGPAHFGGRFR